MKPLLCVMSLRTFSASMTWHIDDVCVVNCCVVVVYFDIAIVYFILLFHIVVIVYFDIAVVNFILFVSYYCFILGRNFEMLGI